jgi:hypothetical protein
MPADDDLLAAIRSVLFAAPQPSPEPDADIFVVAFGHDGHVCFAPGTDNPERLARRLEWFAALVHEHPEIADNAAGITDAAKALFRTWEHL